MNVLIKKYYKELYHVDILVWDDYAEALDLTIKHIKANEFDDKLQIPCTYIVKKILLDNDKFEILDIANIINEFIKYYEDEYENYMNSFALISDQEHADLSFYNEFIENKLN